MSETVERLLEAYWTGVYEAGKPEDRTYDQRDGIRAILCDLRDNPPQEATEAMFVVLRDIESNGGLRTEDDCLRAVRELLQAAFTAMLGEGE